jgi:hypothetical protein
MKPSALSDQPSAEIESGNHDYSILLMADCNRCFAEYY